ncbi:unnamed protein product (macronuclear) [Paramecium tetraurelia]|uniref:Uncharacterized protein n=1 Tax=Paramecium tetraurelia TaxID=5888 RepID=A0DW82_PARTE|nr:uncharacterized protein GSPATT00039802001 [Paramecium tetraurelia]CAK87299.1 unnamed protein product [Paramecium tetraurelia]|eukprot:XP_001454696.1 hypothetical protein (macronuclear) [Paramecium tetraurelia strain d4-2]
MSHELMFAESEQNQTILTDDCPKPYALNEIQVNIMLTAGFNISCNLQSFKLPVTLFN